MCDPPRSRGPARAPTAHQPAKIAAPARAAGHWPGTARRGGLPPVSRAERSGRAPARQGPPALSPFSPISPCMHRARRRIWGPMCGRAPKRDAARRVTRPTRDRSTEAPARAWLPPSDRRPPRPRLAPPVANSARQGRYLPAAQEHYDSATASDTVHDYFLLVHATQFARVRGTHQLPHNPHSPGKTRDALPSLQNVCHEGVD